MIKILYFHNSTFSNNYILSIDSIFVKIFIKQNITNTEFLYYLTTERESVARFLQFCFKAPKACLQIVLFSRRHSCFTVSSKILTPCFAIYVL